MKLSTQELEKIKQSYKAKDLHQIAKAEENKKDAKDNNFTNEEGDQNFISDMVEGHTISETDVKRESVYQKIKEEVDNVINKLHNAVRPIKTGVRSLNNEVGGVEVDYKKSQKKIDQDIDVWDDRTKKIAEGAKEADDQDMEENESFIHKVKTGLYGGKRRKRRRHLGQVDLGKAAEESRGRFAARVSKSKEDGGHQGGIGF